MHGTMNITASKLAFTVCKCRGNDRSDAPELIFCAYIYLQTS